MITAQEGGAKALRQGAHQQCLSGIEAIREPGQLVHGFPDQVEHRRRVAAVASGHRLDEARTNHRNDSPRRIAENDRQLVEARHHLFDRDRDRGLMFARHCGTGTTTAYGDAQHTATGEAAMLFVIIGHDAPDAKEKRPQQRPAHLAYLEPLVQAGQILLAGPFTDGSGSLIVMEAESRAAVWQVVSGDPYVVNGVFNRVDVKPFLQVFPTPT